MVRVHIKSGFFPVTYELPSQDEALTLIATGVALGYPADEAVIDLQNGEPFVNVDFNDLPRPKDMSDDEFEAWALAVEAESDDDNPYVEALDFGLFDGLF